MPRDDKERVQKRERTTIDEARAEGIGEPEEGIEPAVPTYTDRGDVSDLGVDEPVVPRDERGEKPEPAPEGQPDDG
ncbi:MAG TPA: hypothetical protein VGR22_04840 [Thermomicrobiales bacterium]|nr:hypothetical protein [Thermomicrobiales bacterium]